VTVHSVAGYSSASICPNCATPIPDREKRFPDGRRDIHRQLEREPVAAPTARRELEALLGELDRAELDVVALLVTELIANSVKHAGTGGGSRIGLDVAVMPTRIRVEVRDGGGGFTPAPRAAESELHWGLHLIDTLSSRWEVEAGDAGGETIVWFELDRERTAS
jgi:anti-sigma regulatory factor (Ser/Thr protein kinase)